MSATFAKTAIIHDWLVSQGGGEQVLNSLLGLYPSPVYTLVHSPAAMLGTPIEKAEVRASFIQRLPLAATQYRNYLPLFALAAEQFDLSGHELVISVSHAVAKGVLTRHDQLHLCYCLTPMRYAWDLYHDYMRPLGPLRRSAAAAVLSRLRQWDVASSGRVDRYIAISRTVAARIRRTYRREADIVYPPVDTDYFQPDSKKEGHFVAVGRLVAYKRLDLIIETFSRLGLPLVVIGEGPERSRLAARAGRGVSFLGFVSNDEVRRTVARARAFVCAGEEDFGIAPVEALACGTPVIAFGRGGVAETVLDGVHGAHFPDQTVESLSEAVSRFSSLEHGFEPQVLRRQAERFSRQRFEREFKAVVEEAWTEFRGAQRLRGAAP